MKYYIDSFEDLFRIFFALLDYGWRIKGVLVIVFLLGFLLAFAGTSFFGEHSLLERWGIDCVSDSMSWLAMSTVYKLVTTFEIRKRGNKWDSEK